MNLDEDVRQQPLLMIARPQVLSCFSSWCAVYCDCVNVKVAIFAHYHLKNRSFHFTCSSDDSSLVLLSPLTFLVDCCMCACLLFIIPIVIYNISTGIFGVDEIEAGDDDVVSSITTDAMPKAHPHANL